MLLVATQQVAATSGQVSAALIAAVVAAVLGVANILVTVHQGSETRAATKKLADREQWWDRFTWAAEELSSDVEERGVIAVSVLNSLAAVDWIQDDDRNMIFDVFDVLNEDIDVSDLEEVADAQNR